jgi:fused signal recognition particle receptor
MDTLPFGLTPEMLSSIPLEIVGGVVTAIAVLVFVIGGFIRARRVPQLTDEEIAPKPQLPMESAGLSSRFFSGLERSRNALSEGLLRAFGGDKLDAEALESLEEALISADVGVRTATHLTEVLKEKAERGASPEQLRQILRSEMMERIGSAEPIAEKTPGPTVILVVGVNGSGKTTTIGKLAARYTRQGRSVLLAAGDTFRAGAIEQLKVWGDRASATVVAQQDGSDPAAVIFDALESAKAKNVDIVICDTAGRLQAHRPLMEELSKINRIIKRAIPDAPHEVILVLDATIGQNALSQARAFKEATGVTGVALTKLDGTAKGGVVLAVRDEIGVPIKLVGLGEGVDDLRDFEPSAFVDALIGKADN